MPRKPEKRLAIVNIAAVARNHGVKAINALAAALDDDDPRIRLDAAEKLLNRGYGKPSQTIVSADNRPEDMDDDAITAAIRAAVGQRAGTEGEDSSVIH